MSTPAALRRATAITVLAALLLVAPLAAASPAPDATAAERPDEHCWQPDFEYQVGPAYAGWDPCTGPYVGVNDTDQAADPGALTVPASGPCWYVIFDAQVGPVYVDVTHCDPYLEADGTTVLP